MYTVYAFVRVLLRVLVEMVWAPIASSKKGEETEAEDLDQ